MLMLNYGDIFVALVYCVPFFESRRWVSEGVYVKLMLCHNALWISLGVFLSARIHS